MIVRQSAKRLLIRSVGEERYYTAEIKRYFRRVEQQGLEPLFVHQMGKVGSTAVTASLRANGYDKQAAILQSHFLSPQGRAFVEQLEIEGQGGWKNLPPHTQRFLVFSRVLGQMLEDGYLQQHKSKVITLVRDPIATNLSGFFHNYRWWSKDLQDAARSRNGDHMQELNRCFLQDYPHDVPLFWFDMEMKPLFGVDVFASEFPKEAGYKIYKGELVDVLLLKLEKLGDCAEDAIGEFLGLQDFQLVRANEARDKWYAELYREFKGKFVLPPSYADRLYNSRFMEQFYTAAEIETFRQKWYRG